MSLQLLKEVHMSIRFVLKDQSKVLLKRSLTAIAVWAGSMHVSVLR
jgi:hypothetical protein